MQVVPGGHLVWRQVHLMPVSIGMHRIPVGMDQVPTVAVPYG